tara:strand:- start:322 stop:774 length:453 start_codon:yes stop_codon:yes gene_type:complete
MNNADFFETVVPQKLGKLTADAKPIWGSMNVGQMVDHLRIGVVLSIENTDDIITTPEERLPAYKRFLMGDTPFTEGLPKPEAYNRVKAFEGSLEEMKNSLLDELKRMKLFFEENPDHTAVHPNFGHLNPEEWYQLHRKHFTHHFTQFGLL